MEVRVLHIIDSLALGGAEKVAVNLVNNLNKNGIFAWLCATRDEGPLFKSIEEKEKYTFLGRSSFIDFRALKKLISLIKENRINIIHAHSSSFFIATFVSLFVNIRIIWHDHDGNRINYSIFRNATFIFFSIFFSGVVCVNKKMQLWAKRHLLFIINKHIIVLPNFPYIPSLNSGFSRKFDNNSIINLVCVANLKYPKDHLNLLKALNLLKENNSYVFNMIKVDLIGRDYDDSYSSNLKQFIFENNLSNVCIQGAQDNISIWLKQADIGILCSESEGFPVALMEYGYSGLPVICTNVGECAEILDGGQIGMLVPPKDTLALSLAIQELVQNIELRKSLSEKFLLKINNVYDTGKIISELGDFYHNSLH